MPKYRQAGAVASTSSTDLSSQVPCKFFRQGACVAGNACSFSYDLGRLLRLSANTLQRGVCHMNNPGNSARPPAITIPASPSHHVFQALTAVLTTVIVAQGNCKFGPNCAKIYVFPDG
ncbi:hypothetical protein B0T10DRAFT_502331 [Thelonectria olida]|uniref:C3H1-type domain-containing protein n=1 Tax=Thelonectria olida TaxID=1576542 RepID=A0A9P8VQW6_9HYPO|nr:hypothetical protein B0T10DRAFT_502331 [Thelonectria olida]